MVGSDNEEMAHDEQQALKRLLRKLMIHRLTRNLDRAMRANKISHTELSEAVGRTKNWFNRVFNELEDIRVSTFLRVYVALLKLVETRPYSTKELIKFEDIFDGDVLRLAALSNDLQTDNIQALLKVDSELVEFLLGLRGYVENVRSLRRLLEEDEIHSFLNVLKHIGTQMEGL